MRIATDIASLSHAIVRIAIGLLMCVSVAGCSNSPPAVEVPSWDPDGHASKALEQLDTSQDGAIDRKEAVGAPSLIAAFDQIDTNGDGRLAKEELVARFAYFKKVGNGLLNQSFIVQLNGRPASGTRVELIPEAFVADIIQPASDLTDESGSLTPVSKGSDIPAMQVGYFQAALYENETATTPMAGVAPVGVEISPKGATPDGSTPILRFQKK